MNLLCPEKTIYFMKVIIMSALLFAGALSLAAQHRVTGKILDTETHEPLIGANVLVAGTFNGATTNLQGRFEVQSATSIDALEVSYVGYEKQVIAVRQQELTIALVPSVNNLQQVVVTASREAALRTESPVAISKLSSSVIQDTKPVMLPELINKVPGVVMMNYNNEQHGMSIRQPMGLSAYFLYLEDGMPVRPMGIFNHNALIEMNLFGISSLEVVKGPASSLYGPEAVGGAINFITHRPTAVPTARIGVQADQWGYKRFQYGGGGMITKRLGVYIGGFEARQRDAWQAYSDYDKSSVNARLDYALTDKTHLTLAFAGNEYLSDMAGSTDSIAFYSQKYVSTTDFTYRQVHSQRTRLTVRHQWTSAGDTEITLFYRDNHIRQNPNYGIRWTPGSATATGEINYNGFYSRGVMAQHRKTLPFLQTRLLTGGMADYSPTRYRAHRLDLDATLRADGKSVEKYTIAGERPDIMIAHYDAQLRNAAAYAQAEFSPVQRLRVTIGVRYDRMAFDYVNHLNNTEGTKAYDQVTPKAGATFDLGSGKGIYANYSQGFSPPGLTAIFRKRPSSDPSAPPSFYYNLEPARFDNYEIGGWASMLNTRLYIDAAVYQMYGRKELLNIRQPDNSFDYQSAGRTLHRGVEFGITLRADDQWYIRFGGTNAVHRFEEFTLSTRDADKVKNVDGNAMPQSPSWIANMEVTFKPRIVQGLRLSAEWQRISSWYQNQVNTVKYDDRTLFGLRGVSYLNLRAGYTWKGIEVFTNVMNATDELYANNVTRGNNATDRSSYTAAAPRTIVMGIQYNILQNKVTK
jgi:iron complex outermembrane recepter protein